MLGRSEVHTIRRTKCPIQELSSHLSRPCLALNLESLNFIIAFRINTNSSVVNDIQKKGRSIVTENLKKQAKKMEAISDKSHLPVKTGVNITIPVPDMEEAKEILHILFK